METLMFIFLTLYDLFTPSTNTTAWYVSLELLITFIRDSYFYNFVVNYTFVFTLKLVICLVFLSAIKGGVPRYRYDFLTKIGWVKFLGLVLISFLVTFLVFSSY